MAQTKTAFLSPNVNAGQVLPSTDDQQKIFENKFGEMAYQAFAAKHPDILNDVVTFKLLDSNLERGSAVGAFIVEQNGEYLYIPATIADNALKPFDIVYVKSKDMFAPLTAEWLEEIQKGTLDSLGQGAELPDTVATDVDIRNVIVPPTTGRYSYASVQPSPHARLIAEASEPLGRKIANMAMQDPFAGQMGGPPSADPTQAMPGSTMGQGGGGGQGQSQFNPEIWATFVEQFNRIYNMSPGQALDEGMLDIEAMAKMYKSHTKTWEIAPGMGPGGGMAPAGQGTPPMPMGAPPEQQAAPAQGMQPKMANAKKEVADQVMDAAGKQLDALLARSGRDALYGAGAGGVYAGMDRDMGDVPLAMLRGAIGGAALAPVGRMAGAQLAKQRPDIISDVAAAGTGGRNLGALTGGYLMARSQPGTISQWTEPSPQVMQQYYQQNPDMYRTASVNDDGRAMVKHAMAKTEYKPRLTEFLAHAPKTVKQAYASFLQKHPRILKKAASIYGENNLLSALTHKEAGMVSSSGGALYVADKNSSSDDLAQSFGSNTPEAFNGVLLRGYHFKDTRPSLNLAVQTQEYHDFQQAKESGIYRLYNLQGSPESALVINEPLDLCAEDREFFPRDSEKPKLPDGRVPSKEDNKEPNARTYYRDTEGKVRLLAVFGNGDYVECDCLMGEQVTEVLLKGTPLYSKAFTDKKAAPKAGLGFFVFKRGAHYLGTKPVRLSKIKTSTDKTVSGELESWAGMSVKKFVIDPRAPINRPRRLQKQNLVIIPANWKWVPLKDEKCSGDYLRTPEAISMIAIDALGSMGASKAVVRDAGQSQFAVKGSKTLDKAATIRKLATDYTIHAADAEAMMKIAEINGKCEAWVVTPQQQQAVAHRVKTAQGFTTPKTAQGGAPAMQQQPQQPQQPQQMQQPMGMGMGMGGQGQPMQQQPMTPGMAPGMVNPDPAMQQGAPVEGEMPVEEGSAVDTAFQESIGELQQQVEVLQGQLEVLQSVQQRADEIEAENMQGMEGGEMDPMMEEDPMVPSVPMMSSEGPSSEEISAQLNPDFLESAADLHETGAFDAGSMGALAQNPEFAGLGSEYASNLESSLDDLGRTLLTLYMKEPDLKEQLGDETYAELETQLRTTFKGLGKLLLSLTHNSAMLTDHEQMQP